MVPPMVPIGVDKAKRLGYSLFMIMNILRAQITKYSDNGQTIAYVTWRDSRGKTGTTSGSPKNLHMQALLTRAEREGVAIERH